jgi:hypothetical protein
MKSKIKYALIAFFLFFSISAEAKENQKPEWKGTITKEGEVTVVKNPKEPISSDNILVLKEELTIGAGKTKDEKIFSSVSHLNIDTLGNIYIVDMRDAQVKEFDKDGKFIKTIGRKGQGPGEFNMPDMVLFNETGRTFYVFDLLTRRFSLFDLDGHFIRSIPVQAELVVRADIDSKGHIYYSSTSYATRQITVNKCDADMKVIASYGAYPLAGADNPVGPRFHWTVGLKDEVIIGFPINYELLFYEGNGKLLKKIIRIYVPVKLTAKETEEAIKSVPKTKKSAVSEYHSAYDGLFIDDDGHLFVKTWERQPNQNGWLYDVFDAEGRFMAKVVFKGRPFLIKQKKLFSIEEDEDGYQVVKRYQVTWKF